jgi:glycosyltransferase involved in cell wall biosynthesis
MVSPVISVVLFVRNAVTTIRRTLESVCSAQVERTELIVLDGGSTDGTVDVIHEYRHQIAHLRSGADGGPTNAINEGVRRATGRVICLLPADDWLEQNALSIVADEFSKDSDLDVLSCGARIVRLNEPDGMTILEEYRDQLHLKFSLANILRHPLTCARFITKRVYERLGGMDNSWMFPDKDFLIRVYLAKVKSKVRCELAFNFRRHIGSTTNSGRPEMIMKMLSENIELSRHYLAASALSRQDQIALRHLHGGSSAHLAGMLAGRARLGDAGRAIRDAFRSNPTWPLNAVVWYYGSAREKYRHARAR